MTTQRVTWSMVENRAGYIGKRLGATETTVSPGSASYRRSTVIDFHFGDVARDRLRVTYGYSPDEVLDQLAAFEDGMNLYADALKAGHTPTP